MGYVLVNKQTRVRHLHLPKAGGTYKTAGHAAAALRRYDGQQLDASEWEVMEIAAYEKQVPMREVTNLMTGKKVMERADTPWHCSVASESYWSN